MDLQLHSRIYPRQQKRKREMPRIHFFIQLEIHESGSRKAYRKDVSKASSMATKGIPCTLHWPDTMTHVLQTDNHPTQCGVHSRRHIFLYILLKHKTLLRISELILNATTTAIRGNKAEYLFCMVSSTKAT